MTVATVTPANRTPTSTLAKGFGPVPADEEWSVTIRACVSGAASDTLDIRLRKTDGSNAAFRMKDHPISKGGGSQDVERQLVLPAGFEIWDRSAAGNIDLSYTATRRSTL